MADRYRRREVKKRTGRPLRGASGIAHYIPQCKRWQGKVMALGGTKKGCHKRQPFFPGEIG